MPETRGITTTKVINEGQLLAELATAGYPNVGLAILGDPTSTGSKRVWAAGVPDATITTVVGAHTAVFPADPDSALDAALAAASTVADVKAAVRAWVPAKKGR